MILLADPRRTGRERPRALTTPAVTVFDRVGDSFVRGQDDRFDLGFVERPLSEPVAQLRAQSRKLGRIGLEDRREAIGVERGSAHAQEGDVVVLLGSVQHAEHDVVQTRFQVERRRRCQRAAEPLDASVDQLSPALDQAVRIERQRRADGKLDARLRAYPRGTGRQQG